MTENERIEKGREIRRKVLGGDYVDQPGATPTKMQAAFRQFTTENCWGTVWVRDGLSHKERSMLNLAMLSVMARWHEFEVHVRGALNNGVTEDEIVEIILQAGVYAGVPIASEAFKIADSVIAKHGKQNA
ncbi:MAG: carboxymuconolactone decarboxylase family protein [Candidatus Velthaea sp.]